MIFAFGMPGPMELCIIGLIGVMLFGTQLPKVARSLGSSIPSFKAGLKEVADDVEECKKAIEE
jgi:sec-independent protein translocase protein TatA